MALEDGTWTIALGPDLEFSLFQSRNENSRVFQRSFFMTVGIRWSVPLPIALITRAMMKARGRYDLSLNLVFGIVIISVLIKIILDFIAKAKQFTIRFSMRNVNEFFLFIIGGLCYILALACPWHNP